jgi:hypothetical protein
MRTGTLLASCGAKKISREDLQQLPIPEATRTHQPVSHVQIVESLVETLSYRHISVMKDEYAVSPDGMRMFGVLDLDYEFTGCRFSIGIRNSNDKSMRLAMTVGYRVLICDNMAFKGDFTTVLAKHSKRLNLSDSISIGVDKIQRNFEPLQKQVHNWQQHPLDDKEAKLVIYDAFLNFKLGTPRALIGTVHKNYFQPTYEEFQARTLWSLSNAFTTAFKDLKPIKQFQATAKFGNFMQNHGASF